MTRRRGDRPDQDKDEPEKLTDMDRAILAEGRRGLPVREDGETREMSLNEIVTRKTAETAIKGSPHAQRTWFQANAAAEAREAALKKQTAEYWRKYQSSWRKQIAKAKAQGDVPPDPLPHPDDIPDRCPQHCDDRRAGHA